MDRGERCRVHRRREPADEVLHERRAAAVGDRRAEVQAAVVALDQHQLDQGAPDDEEDRRRRRHDVLLPVVEPPQVDAAGRRRPVAPGRRDVPEREGQEKSRSRSARVTRSRSSAGTTTSKSTMRDEDGNPVLDANGQPKKEKGFWLFKNSWGTASFGVDHPYGAGYGWLSMKYVQEYGSAVVAEFRRSRRRRSLRRRREGRRGRRRQGELRRHAVRDASELRAAGGTAHTYTSTPNAAIPDNSPTGVTSTIDVTDTGTIARRQGHDGHHAHVPRRPQGHADARRDVEGDRRQASAARPTTSSRRSRSTGFVGRARGRVDAQGRRHRAQDTRHAQQLDARGRRTH